MRLFRFSIIVALLLPFAIGCGGENTTVEPESSFYDEMQAKQDAGEDVEEREGGKVDMASPNGPLR